MKKTDNASHSQKKKSSRAQQTQHQPQRQHAKSRKTQQQIARQRTAESAAQRAHRTPEGLSASASASMSATAPAPASTSAQACAKAQRCGACSYVNTPYHQQLAAKDAALHELFAQVAGEKQLASILAPTIGMADPWHFRNKVASPFAPDIHHRHSQGNSNEQRKNSAGGGNAAHGKTARPQSTTQSQKPAILTGMYAPGTHRLVNTDGCPVENADANAVVRAIRSIMTRHEMQPYNEDTGTGFVRHVVVRVGHASGEMLVTIVTNGEEFPASRSFCRELVKRCPRITTIVQNINTRSTNVILGSSERTLYGPGFILDELCGLSFRISSRSFYQVNAVQTEVLYRTAIAAAQLTGTETVIDAYCGTGTIGLVAAKGINGAPGAEHAPGAAHVSGAARVSGGARVIGVDNVASAIRDARENARHNGIQNAQFICQDATDFMRAASMGALDAAANDGIASTSPRASAPGENPHSGCADAPSPIVLLMDPPRAGSTPEFLQAAAALAPQRIVYISCNPTTQVRDIAILQRHGYVLKSVQPVDMFPHTPHVETVALMSRK